MEQSVNDTQRDEELLELGVPLGEGYIKVFHTRGNKYKYTFYDKNNNELAKYTHDEPLSLTEQSKVGKEILNSLDPQGRLNRTALIEDFKELKKSLDIYSKIYTEHRQQELERESTINYQESIEEIRTKADQFKELLREHDASVIDFVSYAAEWLASGERQNILIGFLCHTSTIILIKPIWFIVLGRAGEGKSAIEHASITLIPPEYIESGRKTEKAILRKSLTEGENYLHGKVIRMDDLGGKYDYDKWHDTLNQYKILTTEGVTYFEVTSETTDEETGERGTIEFKVSGKPSVCFTSINSEKIDEQFMSRGHDTSPVATNKQVELFYLSIAEGTIPWKKREALINDKIPLLHAYLHILREEYEDVKVINPYILCLNRWFEESEYYKRAVTMYPDLVKTVTKLNIYQRQIIEIEGIRFAFSTQQDNEIIAELFDPSSGLSTVAKRVFNKLLHYYEEYKYDELYDYEHQELELNKCKTIFSVDSARRKLRNNRKFRGLNYSEIFNSLVNAGLLEPVGKVFRSNKNVYRIIEHEKLIHPEIDFDPKLVKKYVDEVALMYETPGEIFWKNIQNEFKASRGFYNKFELPPWVSRKLLEGS